MDCVRNGYGMSEIVGAGIVPPPDSAADIMRKGSVGVVMPGIQVCIRNPDTGSLLGAGEEGEIMFKSETVMKGYLGDAGSTAATVDGDGWLHSGRLQSRIHFYPCSRTKKSQIACFSV